MAATARDADADAMSIAPTPQAGSDQITVLSAVECWALLHAHEVGRLAVSITNHPDIFPINYVVDGTSISNASPRDSSESRIVFDRVRASTRPGS